MKAYDLDNDNAEALANLSGWYINRGQSDKVREYAARALKVAPELPDAHVHMALGLLEAGRYAEAWEHFDYRWLLRDKLKDRRPYKCPKWEGQPVTKLAIHGEQGVGDEILFMTCFKQAAKRAESVVIECMPRLVPLFSRAFGVPCYGGHEELISAEGEPDAYIAMGSLPGIVGLPDGRPYLHMPRQRNKRPVIGLAWRGGTSKTNKRERSLKLEQLRPVLDIENCDFVSVQYPDEKTGPEAEAAQLRSIVESRDIEEAAQAIAKCDLVVSVCQTAVHLSGAMGVPCWVLTPKQCAWRYAGRDDRMLPWYESVKLYRQDDDEKWEPVIERIADDLAEKYA